MTRKATAASAIFEVGQKIVLDILFKPKPTQGSQRYEGVLRLVVVDNQYEDTTVQLIGESYTDDITLDNIHGLVMGDEPLPIESGQPIIVDDDAPGKNPIDKQQCYISRILEMTRNLYHEIPSSPTGDACSC